MSAKIIEFRPDQMKKPNTTVAAPTPDDMLLAATEKGGRHLLIFAPRREERTAVIPISRRFYKEWCVEFAPR